MRRREAKGRDVETEVEGGGGRKKVESKGRIEGDLLSTHFKSVGGGISLGKKCRGRK